MDANLNKLSKAELINALIESIKLQSHYADLLNMHDGGTRLGFTAETWVSRLQEINKTTGNL